jgi:phosphate transport system ATP-binding protein
MTSRPNLTLVVKRSEGTAADGTFHGPLPSLVADPVMEVKTLSFSYGKKKALEGVSFPLAKNKITAIIGPSGCGKSTLLRTMNRIFDLYPAQKTQGEILFEGQNILASKTDTAWLRKRVGMVFQKPTPFPMSIFDNVAYGLKLYEKLSARDLAARVEKALRDAALWDEVKDALRASGQSLSGGQQQRLCIARALAVEPDILLLDEPTSALDPIATAKIEKLVEDLKHKYTIAIVTHNLQQAARLSDYVAFLYMGKLIEFDAAWKLFESPAEPQTRDYIAGRFG